MSLRVVSVTGPATLRLQDRQLVVRKEGTDTGRVPIEDMAALVLDGPELFLSHQLLSFCVDAGVLVVTADERHLPNGLLLPISGHSLHSATLRAQIDTSVPAQKRAWQSVVRAKIRAQADLLTITGLNDGPLRKLIPMVRSGDPDNVEASAAARYFDALFGSTFVRDRDEPGLNAVLNYGYAIIRGAVARAVVGAGLHPALGIHHRNQYNGLCLADDAMEPLRPMVDRLAWKLVQEGEVPSELNPKTKRRIITVLGDRVTLSGLRYPLLVGLERYAAALRRAICEGDPLDPPLPEIV